MRADPGAPPRDAGVGMVEVLVALMIVSLLAVWVAPAVQQATVGTVKMRVTALATDMVAAELDNVRALARKLCTPGNHSWSTVYNTGVAGNRLQILIDFPLGYGDSPSPAECATGRVVAEVRCIAGGGGAAFPRGHEHASERIVVFIGTP